MMMMMMMSIRISMNNYATYNTRRILLLQQQQSIFPRSMLRQQQQQQQQQTTRIIIPNNTAAFSSLTNLLSPCTTTPTRSMALPTTAFPHLSINSHMAAHNTAVAAFHTTAASPSSTTATTPSTSTSPGTGMAAAAFCHHGFHYETCMAGLHGKQLALAQLEGVGKDDDVFDPFAIDEELDQEYEKQQQQQLLAAEAGKDDTDSDSDDDSDDNEKKNGGYEADQEEVSDDDDNDNDDSSLLLYENNGSVRRSASQRAALRAGAPAGGIFAIAIFPDATQHKVTIDDVVICNLLLPITKYTVGSIHTISASDILLMSSSHWTWVGMPNMASTGATGGGASVVFQVEEITMDKKVIIFHKRRRKNSQRKHGFRRQVCMLRILNITAPPAPSPPSPQNNIGNTAVVTAAMTSLNLNGNTNKNNNNGHHHGRPSDLDYYIPRVEPLLSA